MEREDYQRVKSLYQQLLERSPAERREVLAASAVSAEVRAEVEALLSHESHNTAFNDRRLGQLGQEIVGAAVRQAADERDEPVPTEKLPDSIGGFRIEALIGRGGMGIVYRGVQENPARQVAIKVLQSLAASPDQLRRFEYEAEILARLDHPNVAKVFQAGIDRDHDHGDLPYIAMELVEGRDLLTHCRSPELDLRRRLMLFARVCEGVAHAHQHGIVHRDLKPANILVSADGRPRILDFGIARPAAGETTPGRTEAGNVLGSLPWMSPEQARGDVRDIDLRSDVYSLGVLLHQILSGQMPYALDGLTPWDAARVISEVEPKRLGRDRRELAGDLESIAAMALEKEPARRYTSAGDLGRDIERYLELRPVEARGRSASYQLRKFARRHMGMVTAVSVAVLGLIVGVTMTVYGLVSAHAELDRANEVKGVLARMLDSVGPRRAQGEDTTLLKRVLTETAASIDAGDIEDPRNEGELRSLIGSAFLQLEELPEAERHLALAYELSRRELGTRDPRTLRTLLQLADVKRLQGTSSELEGTLRVILEEGGLEPLMTLSFETSLARWAHGQGQYRRSIEALEPLWKKTAELLGPRHPDTLALLPNLGQGLREIGELERAQEVLDELSLEAPAVFGPLHPVTLGAMQQRAALYRDQGRLVEGLEMARRSVAAHEVVFDAHSSRLRVARTTLCQMLLRMNREEELLAFLLDALESDRSSTGTVSTQVLWNLLSTAVSLGRFHEFEALILEEAAKGAEASGTLEDEALEATFVLGRLHAVAGRTDQAITFLERVYSRLPARRWQTDYVALSAANSLGVEYTAAGRLDEARAVLGQAVARCEAMEDPPPGCTVCSHSLAEVHLAAGRFDLAAEQLEGILASYVEARSPYTELTFRQLHEAYARQGLGERAADSLGRWIQWKRARADEPDCPPAMIHAAALLVLQSPYPELRDLGLATELARRACERSGLVSVPFVMTLGRCLSEAGEFDAAVELLEGALFELAENAPEAERAEIEALLEGILGQ